MSKIVEKNFLFSFIACKKNEIEILNYKYVDGLDFFYLCPVDKVPCDEGAYMSFVGRTAKNPEELLRNTKLSVLIVDKKIPLQKLPSCCIVRVENARLFMCEFFAKIGQSNKSVSNKAIIDETAIIGAGTSIGHFSSVGENVRIGVDCIISDGVTILENVYIGDRVIIGPGCVIGTDGFGYEAKDDGTFLKFPHIGKVLIGNDVEIGGNSVIDRGALGDTVIESGVKIDNLVHVAHNVHIGCNSLITANVMLAGGVSIGPGSWIGPSASVLNRVSVGSNTFLGMGVSVIRNIPNNGRFTLKNFLKLFSR